MTRNNWGLLLTAAPLVLGLGVFGFGVAVLGAAPALSADLPVKAKRIVKAPVAPPFSWTGWYIGANAGFGVSQGYGTYTSPAGAVEAFNAASGGGFGGGQLGYNYQFPSGFLGSFVVGVETDIQGAGISDNRTCLAGCGPTFGALIDSKLNWFGTTRGRVGLATGPVLSYVTGGVAYGGIDTGVGTPLGSVTSSTTKTGWTWGTGVEAALGGNWTAKAEYLYIDFGNTSAASPLTGAVSIKNQEQLFRGGINYHFGPAQASTLPPTRNWSGFFAGGTIGADIGRNDSTFTAPGATEAFFLSPRSWDFGGIAGYNWQFGNWVAGVEGDFQGTTAGTGYVTGLADGTGIDQKLDWFGTARARVGYGVGDALFYATGGAAFGEVKESIAQPNGAAGSFSHSKSGFAVGGGIENRLDIFGLLGPQWTTRTEYLFLDLGSVHDSLAGQTLTSNIHDHVWRTVVSYKFGAP